MAYKRGGKYVLQWHDGTRVRTATCATRQQYDDLKRKVTQERFLLKHNLVTREQLRQAEAGQLAIRKAIERLDAHYQSQVKRKAISAAHAREFVRRARYAAELLDLVTVNQITDEALGRLTEVCTRRDLSHWSIGKYRSALKELRRFALAGPREVLPKTPSQRVSRVLSPEEVDRIVNLPHPHPRPARDGRPHPRTDFYVVTIFTGLRWNEARRLEWSNIDFAAGLLHLRDDQTKNKQAATVPLPRIVLERLEARQRRLGAVGMLPVFDTLPTRRAWLNDLQRAGVEEWRNGEQANRKCARKTFTTWLAQAGVDEGTRMRLRRDIGELHERTYTDRSKLIEQQRAGVAKLEAWFVRCVSAVKQTESEAN